MKPAIISTIRMITLAAVAGLGGLTHAWGQGCPASPSYSPDFSNTNNRACLHLNGANNSGYQGSPSFQPVAAPTILQLTANENGWATSAWYTTAQPVANGFSTTFSFQLGGGSHADGIAFVVQNSGFGLASPPANSGVSSLGPNGCGIGFGGASCTSGMGIPNSVAIEFNSFQNSEIGDPSYSDVAIQNCNNSGNKTGPNSVDQSCTLLYETGKAVYDLTTLSPIIDIADGKVHSATVTYATGMSNCNGNPTCYAFDVFVDNVELFPGGVPFDITQIGLTNNSAYAGFTAATGGSNDDQDILSWTFTPQIPSVSQTVTPGQTTTFNFNGGFQQGGYDFTATPSSQQNPNMQMVVTAIPISQQACNALIKNFAPAQCFVYQNGFGKGTDTSVLFEVTCPPSGPCGSNNSPNTQFNAELATHFSFTCAQNENSPLVCPPSPADTSGGSFGFPNVSYQVVNGSQVGTGLPGVGLLKGDGGPDPLHPCTPGAKPLFQSNQIDEFKLGDTSGGAKGGSGGTTSCWLVTYLTPGVLPTVTITQPVNNANYLQGSNTAAAFSCTTADNKGPDLSVGPYLTPSELPGVPTCTATAPFDTSTIGPHQFTVQIQDSAINTAQQTASYTVVPSGSKCSGVFSGTWKGNLTVTTGQSCTIVGGIVTGNVTQTGGTLLLTNTIVRNNLTVQNLPGGANSQICGVTVGNNIQVQNNASPVVIGSSSACANTVNGNLIVQNNSAPTTVDYNNVGGNLLDQSNSGATQVFSNTVSGNLTCQADSSISGGRNTASKKQGQCSTF